MKIELTALELLYIDNEITCDIVSSQSVYESNVDMQDSVSVRPVAATAKLAVPFELLSKIVRGVAALLDITTGTFTSESRDKTVVLDFTDSDVWMLRELAHTEVEVGGERVGLALKAKLYAALYTTAYNEELQLLFDQFNGVDKTDE